MFGLLNDMAETLGEAIGSVAAVPAALIAETLGVSATLVKSAKKAGCETTEEIRDWINENR
jgi:hypothetical protein